MSGEFRPGQGEELGMRVAKLGREVRAHLAGAQEGKQAAQRSGGGRRVQVLVLVLADDVPAVLHVRRPGECGWVLPGGEVPPGGLIVSSASGFLTAQTGIERPVMPGLAFDQTRADPEAGEPETLTYLLSGGVADRREEIAGSHAVTWRGIEELYDAPGITKYGLTAAPYTQKAFTLLLDGEGLYTEQQRRLAARLKATGRTRP